MGSNEDTVFEQMLVHNLKSPLTSILASLEMLRDGDHGELNESQRAAVATMRVQGELLARLIDDLLDVGKFGSPTFHVRRVPVDPAGFLVELRSEWSGRLSRLTSVIAPDVPDAVADVELLRRVFDNLLMNAAVHAGPEATVTLRADRSGDVVRFTVSDDGPGIPAADAARIFEPFVTLATAASHKTHGLGLAYCRAAVAAMGGRISADSAARGATFIVELPSATALARQSLEQDQ
jgi:two-component system sensor histidine kinase/response regulator